MTKDTAVSDKRLAEIRSALVSTPPAKVQDSVVEALNDLQTHRDAWRHAIAIATETAEVSPPDIDDLSYWQHEMSVFDRVIEALASITETGGAK